MNAGEQRRVFVAVRASDPITQICTERQRLAGLPTTAKCVQPADMHITLVPPFVLDSLHEAMTRIESVVSGASAFSVRTDCFTYAPTRTKATMLWLRFTPCAELLELRNSLSEAFECRLDHPQFIAHITMARLPRHFRVSAEEYAQMRTRVDLSMPVDAVELLESPPGIFGGYNTLGSVSLCTPNLGGNQH
ncbi:MAG: 2'-5' RNA ligase family protein [Gammaproteobacteria bacterium]|nr:2'-5' RNA ligase family protein [Gammaproteobacteria bacterium]